MDMLNATASELRQEFDIATKLRAFRIIAEGFDIEDVPMRDFLDFYFEIGRQLRLDNI